LCDIRILKPARLERAMSKHHDVAVIGAGVFGSWTAWHLRRAGQRVLLIDKYGPANARASSGGETRVIRMAYGPDDIYTQMSQHSLTLWQGLFRDIGRPELFRRTGVLWLLPEDSAIGAQSLAALVRHGVAHQRIDTAALAARYPQLDVPAGGWAILEPDSGGLLARRAVQAVAEDALHAGVDYLQAGIVAPRGSGRLATVASSAGDTIHADKFVFACGPWLGSVLPDALGGRIFPTRQEVFYFGTPAGDSRFAAASFPIWLDFDRDFYGFPDIDGRGFKVAHDSHGDAIDPDSAERSPTPSRIAAARAFLARRFPALAEAPLLGAEVCQYENTSNGDFVIDRHPGFDNVWIAGGGSGHGFKHGPAVGEYAAQCVLGIGAAEPRFSLSNKTTTQKREVH
jgi:sarcosine oxidase